MIEYGSPVRWMCKLCQSPELKLINPEKCQYQKQFKNPKNIVLAPAIYLLLEQVKNYNPAIVAIDDVVTCIHRLPTLTEMNDWLSELNKNRCTRGMISRYSNLAELFKEQRKTLPYFVNELEHNLKEWIAGIQENVAQIQSPGDFPLEPVFKYHKKIIRSLLRIDPATLIEWHSYVEKYGYREEFARLHILEAFELSFQSEVYIINALPNKRFIDAMIQRFEKETDLTISPIYDEVKLEHPIAKSTFQFPSMKTLMQNAIKNKNDIPPPPLVVRELLPKK